MRAAIKSQCLTLRNRWGVSRRKSNGFAPETMPVDAGSGGLPKIGDTLDGIAQLIGD